MLRTSAVLLLLGGFLASSAVAEEDAEFQKIRKSFLGKWQGELNVGGPVESEWTEPHPKFLCARMEIQSPLGKQSYILLIGRDDEGLKSWMHKPGKKVREATVSWDGNTMVTVGPPNELGLTHFFYEVGKDEVTVRGCPGKDAVSLFEITLKRQKEEPQD